MYKFLILFLLLSPVALAQSNSICDCERIKRELKCDNPDCIKICNLESFFNQINLQLNKQCLKSEEINKKFKKKKISAMHLESFSQKVIEHIKKLEADEKQTLEKNCPDCGLVSKISADIDPILPKKTCPQQYLKVHSYSQAKKLSLKNERDCGETEKKKLIEAFTDYSEEIIRGKTEASKKLWNECPDGCSFDISYVIQINEEDCSGNINLNIACTHRVKKSFWNIPIYNVSIDYEGVLKCAEKS